MVEVFEMATGYLRRDAHQTYENDRNMGIVHVSHGAIPETE